MSEKNSRIEDRVDVFSFQKEFEAIFPGVGPEYVFKNIIKFYYILAVSELKLFDEIFKIDNTRLLADGKIWICSGYQVYPSPENLHFGSGLKPSSDNLGEGTKWVNSELGIAGRCFVSLVKNVKKLDTKNAILLIAKIIGIDFSQGNVSQISEVPGYGFMPGSHKSNVEQGWRLLFKFILDRSTEYVYRGNRSRSSINLLVYRADGFRCVLFSTVQRNSHTGEMCYALVAPPAKYLMFKREYLLSRYCERVFIFDEEIFLENMNSNLKQMTWAGNLDICKNIDWEILKGKEICYYFRGSRQESLLIGKYLFDRFAKVGIKLNLYKYSAGGRASGRSSWFGGFLGLEDVTILELDKMVSNCLGSNINYISKLKSNKNIPFVSGLKRYDENRYVLDDIIRDGEIIIIVGKGRIGKSLFSADVAISVASGRGVKTKSAQNDSSSVLLIATDFPEGRLVERLKKMVPDDQARSVGCKLSYLNMYDLQNDFDISSSEHRVGVIEQIRNCSASVIIFDSPLSLVNIKECKNRSIIDCLQMFFEEIVKAAQGKTLIIICDEEKNRITNATIGIENNIDCTLLLERPDNYPSTKTGLEVIVRNPRYLSGDQCAPFFVSYREYKSKIIRLARPADSQLYSLPITQRQIIENARKADFINVKTLKDAGLINELSSSCVTENLKILCENGWLIKEGDRKSTKYFAT
ncbi:AAA domain-containing protein [Desulfopila aestuarii DSM 18488]|uniref:AAA domain-containing protein n=2 Tax=Desulfopila aestuarii TaxID=231440 RepID=A0A1M7YCT7_9BACT|nr:AAA domain-containing protein [Desulfopila aestuarii DSM 18488]